MIPSRLEVMRHLDDVVGKEIPNLLVHPDKIWQPSDFLPDLRTEEGMEELHELREESKAIPDDVLVTMIGDTITEEALPTYASWIFPIEGVDRQGEPRTAWGNWNRGWCAEENRHGDIMKTYLYLTGRVDMREVEVTISHLITDGGDTQTDNDPYRTFIYTSFQEIATRISHLNVGKLAGKAGATRMEKLSKRVAGDEHRHSKAYRYFIEKIMEVDPDEVVIALQDMMKKKIIMPARYMREGGMEQGETFKKFEVVATRNEIYTPNDYIDIVEELIKGWDIEHLTNLSPEAAKAQDYLCNLPERYRKVLNRFRKEKESGDEKFEFKWLIPPALNGTSTHTITA